MKSESHIGQRVQEELAFKQIIHDFLFLALHTCDIFLEPDREIWDFSEGDWGLR